MNFFEYLFCRLYWWFTVVIKEKDIPVGSSVIGLSGFLLFSLVPFINVLYVLLYDSYKVNDNPLGNNLYFAIILVIILINYFYFNKQRYKKLLLAFDKISKKEKKKKDIYCIIYIVSLIVVNTLLVAYFRSKNLQ